jgi:hypothetical protein
MIEYFGSAISTSSTGNNMISFKPVETEKSDNSFTHSYNDFYQTNLPSSINLFSSIINRAYSIENEKIKFNALYLINSIKRNLITHNMINTINNNLSKLSLNEVDDDGVLIEWNFDRFRIGFTIENDKESNYFIVSNDLNRGDFYSESHTIKNNEYDYVANDIVNFVVRNT